MGSPSHLLSVRWASAPSSGWCGSQALLRGRVELGQMDAGPETTAHAAWEPQAGLALQRGIVLGRDRRQHKEHSFQIMNKLSHDGAERIGSFHPQIEPVPPSPSEMDAGTQRARRVSQATQWASVWTGSQGFPTPSPLVCPSDWPWLHLIRPSPSQGGHKFPSPGDKAGSQAVPKLEGDAGLGPWSCQTWSSAAQVPLHGPRRRLCLPHSMRPTKSQLKQSPGSRIPLNPSQRAAFRLTSLNVRILFRGLSVLKHSRQKLSLEPGHGACPQSCAGGRWVTRCGDSGRETEAGRPRRRRWVVPGQGGAPRVGWERGPQQKPGETGSPC